jgi:hypothetical protein
MILSPPCPRGEATLADVEASRRWHEARDGQSQSDVCATSRRRWVPPWPELETQMAYGRALMDGYGALPFLPYYIHEPFVLA